MLDRTGQGLFLEAGSGVEWRGCGIPGARGVQPIRPTRRDPPEHRGCEEKEWRRLGPDSGYFGYRDLYCATSSTEH